jgi:Protein of unknown function (DUF3568)
MKIRILAVTLGALAVMVGCVSTVNDRSTVADPFVKDRLENRYERSMGQVYDASLWVMKALGTVSRESVINPGTNEVKSIEGKVNDRKVWMRVQSVDPKVTAVTVQVRTSTGASDKPLTHDIATQIAVRLTATSLAAPGQ